MAKLLQEDVLTYQYGRQSQQTVKRHYLNWREQQNPPIPIRCDNEDCIFFIQPLEWNGKKLNLILDHIKGVHGDNRPKNLRFLCPNCNSQQSTNGGGNRDKVRQNIGGFAVKRTDGKFDHEIPIQPLKVKVELGSVEFGIN